MWKIPKSQTPNGVVAPGRQERETEGSSGTWKGVYHMRTGGLAALLEIALEVIRIILDRWKSK